MQYLLFIALAPAALALSTGIGIYAWRRRSVPAARSLSWMAFAIAGWLICNTLELLWPTDAGTLAWARLTYVFIQLAATTWLLFALDYTGRQSWLAPGRIGLLLIFPLAITLLVFTNDLHGLIWRSYTFRHESGIVAMRVTTYGPLFWLQVGYNYASVLIGAALVGRLYLTAPAPFRDQARLAILGAVTPLIVNFVYISRLIPGFHKDYSPLGWALGGAAFAIAIFRYHLLDLMPMARQALVDTMIEGMLVLDTTGRIVDINPVAQAIIGLTPPQAIGRHLRQVWPAGQAVLASQAAGSGEVYLTHASAERCYDVRAAQLTDRRGRVTGSLILLRDITVHKQAEARLQQICLALEARNADLDTFARTAAHDLKRPLSVIVGQSDLAMRHLRTDPDPFLQECLEGIAHTGRRMAHIVDELLFLASVRQQDLTPETVNMADTVTAALRELADMATGLSVQIQQPPSWPQALGHAPWIEQVWINLISNALKYGGRPPRIELGWESMQASAERAMLRFWVRDYGPGLSQTERERLFVPFTRLQPDHAEGSGLGLCIVRSIVEKLGGRVGVEEAPGGGSRFHFDLPAAQGPVKV